MTLIVGWVCTDGIVLAGDDETMRETGSHPSQRGVGEKKIKKIGKDCAVGISGPGPVGRKTVNDLGDRYGDSDAVDVNEFSEALKKLADERHSDVRDLSLLIAGYKQTVDGKRATIYQIAKNRPEDKTYAVAEIESGGAYGGLTYLCNFMDLYMAGPRLTVEQGAKLAAILIAITHRDSALPVGELGALAKISNDACELIEDLQFLEPYRETAERLRSAWAKALSDIVVRGIVSP